MASSASSGAAVVAAGSPPVLVPGGHMAHGTPRRAWADRLRAAGAEDCPWQSYLPGELRNSVASRNVLLQKLRSTVGNALPNGFDLPAVSLDLEGSVQGKVWSLSRDPLGCRVVQRALEEAGSDQEREALAKELHGLVWEALQCPHANHVLQRCIVCLRPEACQFIIDELTSRAGPVQAAGHKYGCRIVQRLVEFLPWSQTSGFVDHLLEELDTLARHAYGNYVVQNLLQHGTEEHRGRILGSVFSDVAGYATNSYGVAVIGAVLQQSSNKEKSALAEALAEGDNLLVTMSCSRLGFGSIPVVLRLLSDSARSSAIAELQAQATTLEASRFGRHALESLRMWGIAAQRDAEDLESDEKSCGAAAASSSPASAST